MSTNWQKRQPRGYSAPARRKWQYGITEEEFQARKAKQNNRCAMCFEIFVKTPCIDHDHETEEIRGLLCRFCNLVLGNAHDSIEVLQGAIKYLKEFAMADEKKHAGHGFTHTHVEHHADGSHTIHHVHEKTAHKHGMPHEVGEHDVKGAAGDHDGMIDHLMDNTSHPNPGEGAAAPPMGGAAPGGIPPAGGNASPGM
jgi:hypothetical protein